jgi:hypothetical protein
LLDLHNLYANAVNFGRDPFELLREVPFERVRSVHLSGGVEVADGAGRVHLLDDHLHDPPEIVFELLEEVASYAPLGLTVIVERDGAYPEFDRVLDQLQRARLALARGRAGLQRSSPRKCGDHQPDKRADDGLQHLLAAILSDPDRAGTFLLNRKSFADALGVKLEGHPELLSMDQETLLLAARSYASKRDPERSGRTRRNPAHRCSDMQGFGT